MRKLGFAAIAGFYLLFLYFIFILSGNSVQQYRVGILSANDERLLKVEGLKESLADLRYIEEENIQYTVLNAKANIDRLTEYAENLVDLDLDVIVATGTAEAYALAKVTSEMDSPTPIIFMGILSPEKLGFTDHTTKPTENLTGLDSYYLELIPKRFQLFHSLIPNTERIAVIGDQRILGYKEIQNTLRKVIQEYPLETKLFTVSNLQQVETVFKEIDEQEFEGILLLPGYFIETSCNEIIKQANQRYIPIFGLYPQDAEKGCLASYGTSYYDLGAQSARIVDKVLKGVEIHDIPIETPDRLDFVINLNTAYDLGIELSPELLSFADRIIGPLDKESGK